VPPADTYCVFYAIDHEYDEAGDIVLSRFYEVQRFELLPVVESASPCFIDLEESPYPGIHVTSYLARVQDETEITDPFNPPNGVTERDINLVLTAEVRMVNLGDYEDSVKAVTSYSDFEYPAAAAGCIVDGIGADEIPAPTCYGNEDNAQRLRLCHELWDANPDRYEGSDKVFTLANNGAFYGLVHGMNPVNQAPVGGATMFVDEVLTGFDAFSINWQYKDEGAQTSPTGTTFMVGEPESRTRGVINAHLVSPFSNATNCQIGIFSDLGSDDVTF